MNQKSKTFLLVGDRVVKAEGKNVTSVSDLKSLAFHEGQKNTVTMTLEIIRQGKVLTVSEPLADLTGGTFGPEDLLALKQKYY